MRVDERVQQFIDSNPVRAELFRRQPDIVILSMVQGALAEATCSSMPELAKWAEQLYDEIQAAEKL